MKEGFVPCCKPATLCSLSLLRTIPEVSHLYPRRAVEWLYTFLLKLLVSGEPVPCAGDIVLPKLDNKQPPEHTQLICLITALVSAARKQVCV